MQFGVAISEHPLPATAVGEVTGDILESIGPEPDALALFVTPAHAGALEDIAPAIHKLLRPGAMIGCVGDGVIGTGQEVLHDAAISVWAARGCDVKPMRLSMNEDLDLEPLPKLLAQSTIGLLLADPRTYAPDALFTHGNAQETPARFIGGYAAQRAGFAPGLLVLDGELIDGGAVCLMISSRDDTAIETTVAQGSRPIGSPLVVTRCDATTIYELAGSPALERLTAMLKSEVGDEDLSLAGDGLLIGKVIEEHKESFGIGDFVVSQLHDTDPVSGSLTVSGQFEVGNIVQFQVRDERAASVAMAKALAHKPCDGALMFASSARGYDMFDTPSHDALAAAELLHDPPLAGLMTSGEFAPVAGRNVVNGLTASLALFSRPRS